MKIFVLICEKTFLLLQVSLLFRSICVVSSHIILSYPYHVVLPCIDLFWQMLLPISWCVCVWYVLLECVCESGEYRTSLGNRSLSVCLICTAGMNEWSRVCVCVCVCMCADMCCWSVCVSFPPLIDIDFVCFSCVNPRGKYAHESTSHFSSRAMNQSKDPHLDCSFLQYFCSS